MKDLICWSVKMFSLTLKVFVLLLIKETICVAPAKPLNPFAFQFQHYEDLFMSDGGEDDPEDANKVDGNNDRRDRLEALRDHIRKRRSVKWFPDYDLYGQWAQEYYANNEGKEDAADKRKGDILDKLGSKTKEEVESQKKVEESQTGYKKIFLITSWIVCILIVLFIGRLFAKKCLTKCGCDFCYPFSFKSKIKKKLNLTPGVYVHSDGSEEQYTPTDEEMDALYDVKRLLHGLY